MKQTTVKAWIARDKNGGLSIYHDEPIKYPCDDEWAGFSYMWIDKELFPQIKWEDEEPKEVELTIKIKE